MMPMRTLFFTALPLLVLSSEVRPCSLQSTTSHGHPVLDSLQCYNDFTTHMRCTWEEDPHTHSQLVITNEQIKAKCVSDGPGVLLPNGKRYRSCVYKTNIFHWGKWTVYSTTSCPSNEATLHIAQQGKVLSPVNVTETKVVGGRMLSWSSPYPSSSPLTNSLTYQVKYRRHGHDWTVVGDINTTQWVIKEQELPGYEYEARVRARGRVGLWSNWSHPVSWITEEEGVFNLQCVIEEGGVLCSWQVKREHAQFLSFYLCSYTNGSSPKCLHCANHINQPGAVLDFTCLMLSSEPEMLTMKLKSVRNSKDFANPSNIQPPRLNPVQVSKKDGIWKLTWSRPDVSEHLRLSYQLQLYNNDTGDLKLYNLTEGDFCLNLSPSTLGPSNTYMAQVRALPSDSFSGRPSDWSEPVYFKSGPAFSVAAIIYTMTAVVVAMFFIILYKALPSCHRRLELWKVSIPSPIKSRVLEDISSKSSPAVCGNPYSEKEKTSVCIMQPSDNPIICKGSISEYPLLPYSDDDLTKSECTHGLDRTSSYIEGSGISVKSAMSFTGPYILCQQDSSLRSETPDTSFYSNSTFEEDSRSIISENPTDSLAANGGYVSSPPASLPSTEHSASSDNPATGGTNPGLLQLPKDDPPAYTPNPTAMAGILFSNSSGYCLMPNMEIDVADWVQASAPPPGGNTDRQSIVAGDGDQSARGYVTLSQPAI